MVETITTDETEDENEPVPTPVTGLEEAVEEAEEDRSTSGRAIPIVVSRKAGESEESESEVLQEGVVPVVLSVIDS